MILYAPKMVSIRSIQLRGERTEYFKSVAEPIVLPYLGKKIFTINVKALQNKLLKQFPWIESVIVRQSISGVLTVHVKPRIPVARFESLKAVSDKILLMDKTGYLFEPGPQYLELFNHLPIFKGLQKQAKDILQFYRALNTILRSHTLQVSKLQVDQEMRFNVQLSNGIQLLLGHLDPVYQLKRLLSANAQVLHRADQISAIDLRYFRGAAVKLHESIK